MFRLCYNKQTNKKPTWSRSRASSEKSLLCMSMSSRASKSKSMIKKLNEKKNRFVWMFRIDLKKQTNYCDKKQKENKKQFTHQSDSVSLRCFNEKNKTTSDNRAAISSSAPSKMKENKKKITNRNRKQSFSCFFNNTTKGRTFQFLMTISMPAILKTFKKRMDVWKQEKTKPTRP